MNREQIIELNYTDIEEEILQKIKNYPLFENVKENKFIFETKILDLIAKEDKFYSKKRKTITQQLDFNFAIDKKVRDKTVNIYDKAYLLYCKFPDKYICITIK